MARYTYISIHKQDEHAYIMFQLVWCWCHACDTLCNTIFILTINILQCSFLRLWLLNYTSYIHGHVHEQGSAISTHTYIESAYYGVLTVWMKPTFELLVTLLLKYLCVWLKAYPMNVSDIFQFPVFLVTSIVFSYLWIILSNQHLVLCTTWLDNTSRLQIVSMLSSSDERYDICKPFSDSVISSYIKPGVISSYIFQTSKTVVIPHPRNINFWSEKKAE